MFPLQKLLTRVIVQNSIFFGHYTPFILLVCYYLPRILGTFNHYYFQSIRQLRHEKFGRSTSSPIILHIRVAKDSTEFPLGVGKLVHEAFYKHYPPFHFNVNFASSQVNYLFQSDFANPFSIWYNVFFGCYEIKVFKTDGWKRPFGYHLDKSIIEDDFIRLLKADWNYFSNYLYGVPLEQVQKYNSLNEVTVNNNTMVTVGKKKWNLLEIGNIRCVGPALSKHDTLQYQCQSIVNLLWRGSFGNTNRRFNIKRSFDATSVLLRLHICFVEEQDCWKTYVFGATKNETYSNPLENDQFLELQTTILKELIETKHSNLGF